jgi:hypothetical protein
MVMPPDDAAGIAKAGAAAPAAATGAAAGAASFFLSFSCIIESPLLLVKLIVLARIPHLPGKKGE